MKILYITLEAPSDFSGGGIGIKQSLLSLVKNYNVDYIGPYIKDLNLKKKINSYKVLEYNKSKKNRFINLTKGITTGYYNSWLDKKKEIKWGEYGVVYVEFSRYDFIIKEAKLKDKKVVLRIHNIERDYYYNLLRENKKIINWLRYFFILRQERESINDSDLVLFLTKKDRERATKLYGKEMKTKKNEILPVCLDSKNQYNFKTKYSIHNEKIKFLITGSLWYGANLEGVLWFIKNIWSEDMIKKNNKFHLVVAGSKPNKLLKNIIGKYKNITLEDTPLDMEKFFTEADIYVAPIFRGAGMKVKIAESLSYGLPILGTPHSFIGYEIKDKINGFFFNTKKEFFEKLGIYLELTQNEKIKLKELTYKTYLENNSLYYSQKKLENIIENVFKGDNFENKK